MRTRVRYSKTGKLRYVSAIDLGRIWERALRRADLPIAYSEGFSPHPKVSFPDALPLGYGSDAEYAELQFAGPFDLDAGMARLDAAFPEGIAVRDAVEVAEGAPRLAKWLRASLWELAYPEQCAPALARAAGDLLAAERIPVDRDRKGEVTETDLRPALHQICTVLLGSRAVVRVVLHHTEPPMRPSEVDKALRNTAAGHASTPLPALLQATRLAQGEPTTQGIVEALSGEVFPAHRPPDSEEGDHDRARQF